MSLDYLYLLPYTYTEILIIYNLYNNLINFNVCFIVYINELIIYNLYLNCITYNQSLVKAA